MLNHKQPCDEAAIYSARECAGDGSPKSGAWILAATIIGSSITFIDGTVVNVALPVLQEKLGASVTQIQWVVESYALMLSALILVGGVLGDKYGRKLIFSIGIVVFALSSLWCGLVSGANGLIIARAVQGIGAALLVPGSLAIISATFPKKSRAKAIGTWSGFTAIAAGFGPILGGWLVEHISWRWIFFINLPLAFVVLLITWKHVPETRDEEAKKGLDWPGAVLATIGLGGIVYGLTESGTVGFYNAPVAGSIILGVLSLAAFVVVEAKSSNPMMPLGLFRSKTFAGANLLTLCLYSALSGILFFLPFNLIRVQGYSPTAAGSALVPFVLTMFLLSRWASGLVDRFGSKIPLIVGPVITGFGFALFAVTGSNGGSYWTTFFPAIMVMSIGMTISVAPLTTTVMGAVDERHAGTASGINNAVSRTAGLLAVAVFGFVMLTGYSRALETRTNTPDFPAVARSVIDGQKDRLLDIDTSSVPDRSTRDAINTVVKDSFLTGFKWLALLAAGLAFASAFFSWLLIEGKAIPKSSKKTS
jgi:EmrB/QacA subfamily drug resistance transporter